MNWSKIIEHAPNFSEGRDPEKIDKIVAPFRDKSGVGLFDYSNGEDHNCLVATLVGGPEALRDAVIEAIDIAVRLVGLNHHSGRYPHIGAVDVVPLIPIRNTTMEETVVLSKEVASRVVELYNLPVFLYEKSTIVSHRKNLVSVRKGEFEGMVERARLLGWQPDSGPAERYPTAGTVAISTRMPLVAYNTNPGTDNLEIATEIARSIRHINGGLRYAKVMGAELKERNITQVSTNMTDYTCTVLYRAFELVRIEVRRYGVAIAGSEVIGLVSMEVLIDTTSCYLGLENFSMQRVLEACIME